MKTKDSSQLWEPSFFNNCNQKHVTLFLFITKLQKTGSYSRVLIFINILRNNCYTVIDEKRKYKDF